MVTSLLPGKKRDSRKKVRQVPRPNSRPDLQGMRAVAVLAVFADHLFAWPSGGFVGVDVFFVLSGFFITGMLIRERNETGTISFKNFYTRRVRRIIPSALLVLFVTVVFSYILFPAVRAKETLVDALWAALFAANVHFERVGTDYFQEGQPPSPLQHYWSLSIEEQFYFVWPLLLLGIYLWTRKSSHRGSSNVRQIALATSMAIIVAASFIWAVTQSASNPSSAYFSSFTRVWELGVGALVAICGPLLVNIPKQVRPVLAYVGLAGVAASLFLINASSQFPGPWAALPVFSTALVVAAFHGSEVFGMAPLTNRVAHYFGDTSYTLYLWHWPVIVLLAAVMQPDTVTYYVAVLVLSFGLTHLTFYLYENPIRHSKWLEQDTTFKRNGDVRFKISPQSWSMTGFIVAASLLAGLLTIQIMDRDARVGELSETLVVASDTKATAPVIDPCFGAASMVNTAAGCPTVFGPNELVPSLNTFAKDNQGAYSCWRGAGGPMPSCTYGSKQPDALKVAIIGDSHAAMLTPALADQIVGSNWSLTTFLGNGCQWQKWENGNRDCQSEMEKVQDRLVNGDKFDLVITTSSRAFGGASKSAAAQAYVDAWEPVAARGTKIVAVTDSPTATEESIACVTRFGADADAISRCGLPRSEALAEEDSLIRATKMSAAASLIDMTDLFCTVDQCPMVIGGVIVYRDAAGHISATFSKTMGPALVDRIKTVL